MSQIRKSTLITLVSALAITAIIPAVSHAASYTDLKQPARKKVTYKASFNDVEDVPFRILDWRNPSVEFTFDVADHDWTDNLELLLSADPLGRVNSSSPIMVQFNNGKPTPVYTRGQGFDARITLDAARIRPRRNKVTFTYKAPAGAECLTPQQGGWQLNFKNSFVVVKARAKSRNYQLREIESRLANGTIAPKSVSLLARGPNTTKLQALAAQGIGLRMNNLPEFKVSSGRSDFEVVLGTRSNLYHLITDSSILDGEGPRVLVHEGRPMRLVITGDTDAEVMATAQSFATHRLPSARRTKTSLGEMNMQSAFALDKPLIEGTEKFTEIGGIYFSEGWGPAPKVVKFDVADPAASHGEILLRVASNRNVANDSRLSVNLNGQSLGFTKLDKARKSVAFDIPEGMLQGTDNTLTLSPDLNPVAASGCQFTKNLPGFYLGDGSKIKIKANTPSPVTELSRFAATGAPFSIENGANTVIILPSTSSKDYTASLKVLAKLAKSSGSGWTKANFTRSSKDFATDKNVLVIGASHTLGSTLRQSAPKALTAALKGQILDGNSRLTAGIERFASADANTTMRLYAARQLQNGRIRSGGVAALYPSSQTSGKVIGVITNGAGMSFSKVAAQMIETKRWNQLEGSISRWNTSTVLMAQTASHVPGFTAPKSNSSNRNGFKLPEFHLPEFEAFAFSEIDMSWAKTKLANARAGLAGLTKTARPKTPKAKPTQVKLTQVKTTPSFVEKVQMQNVPKAKIVKAKAIPQDAVPALRGRYDINKSARTSTDKLTQAKLWVAGTSRSLRDSWNNLDLKSSIRDLQGKSRPMGHKIKGFFKGQSNPATKTVAWGEQNMSIPAMLLILVFGGVFLLMGLARPTSRLGGRH